MVFSMENGVIPMGIYSEKLHNMCSIRTVLMLLFSRSVNFSTTWYFTEILRNIFFKNNKYFFILVQINNTYQYLNLFTFTYITKHIHT